MTNKSGKPTAPVKKPFLTGNPTDERTFPAAAGFFGVLLIAAFMSFLVSTMMGIGGAAVRIILNGMLEVLILIIFFNNASGRGADAVARGEILYQKQEAGKPFSASEKAVCFHPAKGYLTALLGSLPFLIVALALAFTAHRQTTGVGALPSWIGGYMGRSDVGDALVAYTVAEGMKLEDILRIAVRVMVMPFISMVGTENRDGLLLVERLSPLLVLLPALAYGTGYLTGRNERTRIHTGIAENNRRRIRKEKKARKARMARKPRGPEQLN